MDLRYALRSLRNDPGFTMLAVIVMALGIGANTAVFSVVNAVLLRPLAYRDAERIVTVASLWKTHGTQGTVSAPDFHDWHDQSTSFAGMALYDDDAGPVSVGSTAEYVHFSEVTPEFFNVFSVEPVAGRALSSQEWKSGASVVIGYAYWQSHFQGAPGVVNRVVQLNKFNFTILGIAPPGFRGTELFFAPDLWAPMVNEQQIDGLSVFDQRGSRGKFLVGRLKAGVSPAQAAADLNFIAVSLARTYPKDEDGISFALSRTGLLGDFLGGPVRAFIAGLTLLAGLILLAACANLGSLFSARAADR